MRFGQYRRESLFRRIRRRMRTVGIEDLAGYRDYLNVHPEEHGHLCRDVPVHRTEFLRDPAAWGLLASRYLPALLADKRPGDGVRAWSAGCATGEEAYTLAMVLLEVAAEAGFRGPTRVYGTDVSERAVERARAGRFSGERLAALPAPLRDRHFARHGDDWRPSMPLRRSIVFAGHDLLRDPPLGRVDVLVCRNTLMYFTPEAQAQVLARLYLGLEPGGILFTGNAENPGAACDLFTPRRRGENFYAPIAGLTARALRLLGPSRASGPHDRPSSARSGGDPPVSENRRPPRARPVQGPFERVRLSRGPNP